MCIRKSSRVQSLVYHVLFLGEDGEERVMPLLYVDVQEAGGRQGALAGATHVPVEGVVVVLVLLNTAEHLVAS